MSTHPNHIRMINDARCDCDNPCILNSDLDEAESKAEKLQAELDAWKAYAVSMEEILRKVGVSESLINEGRSIFIQ
jgi:hypothetical protein